MVEILKKGSKEATMKFFGALKDKGIGWEEKERRMKAFREEFNKRIEITVQYISKRRLEKP